MNKIYTGIGSRSTPQDVLDKMEDLAYHLSKNGWTLRSGGAPGADTAFEIGHCVQKEWANGEGGSAEIFLPWNNFENRGSSEPSQVAQNEYDVAYIVVENPECNEIASQFHPAWQACSQGARRLHARNVCQVLGKDLQSPVDFVVCWTEDGKVKGGTATAIKIAQSRGIKVYNLAVPSDEESLLEILGLDYWPSMHEKGET